MFLCAVFGSFVGYGQPVNNLQDFRITVFEGQRFSIGWENTYTTNDTLVIKFGTTKGGDEYGLFKVLLKQKRSERIITTALPNMVLDLFASYYVKTSTGLVSSTFEAVYKKSDAQDRSLSIDKGYFAINTCLAQSKAYAYVRVAQPQQVKIDILNSGGAILLTGYNGVVSQTGTIDFSINSLPVGIYNVMIQIGTKTITRKIVK